VGAEAEVPAVAEADVGARVARDVEAVRVVEDRGIAIGRADPQQHR
jgi:hypothetical protein